MSLLSVLLNVGVVLYVVRWVGECCERQPAAVRYARERSGLVRAALFAVYVQVVRGS